MITDGVLDGLVRVRPDDLTQVAAAVALLNEAQAVDDPDGYPQVAAEFAPYLEYGWELEPPEVHLYTPPGAPGPVAVLTLDVPRHDNRHLVEVGVTVRPSGRRQGHGSRLLAYALQQAEALGRGTVWTQVPEPATGACAFLERFGFGYASHDARRRQVLAELDRSVLDRLEAAAREASRDYELVRLLPPEPDEVLAGLVAVTAAINDAPMGDLTFEDEVFDVARLRDAETARVGRGDQRYRVVARCRSTGEVAGHTFVVLHPLRPWLAHQADTAVARPHRGHRLGLLLKIEMLRWLAETEPQVEVVETWNQADNRHMVGVNEALGYRLAGVFDMYERRG